jgi:perosamine synthetase
MRAEDVERRITNKTRVLVGSTALGCPAGLDGMAALATRAELPMVEYVGAALGAWVGGDRVGHFGRIAVLDLGAASPLSTGTGGVILTNDDHLATTMSALRNGERALATDGTLLVRAAGMDAPMDDLRATLGLARLGGVQSTIEGREEIAAAYIRRLGGNSDLILQTIPPAVRMGWCWMLVRLSDRFSVDARDEIIAGLGRHEIGTSPGIQLASDTIAPSPVEGGPWPVAERAAMRSIALPFHTFMTEREIELVCQTLELMMQRTSFRREDVEDF